MKDKTKRRLRDGCGAVLTNLFLIVCCAVALVPILYAFSVSLNAQNTLVSTDFSFIPENFTVKNYAAVFTEQPMLTWLANSTAMAVCTLFISLGVAIPAAYAFSRYRFRGRKMVLYILLLLNAFPTVLSMFAIYRLMRPLGLNSTRTGLVIIYTGTMAIFALWNLKGYFDTIPQGIEEAAKIDGASDLQLAAKIVLPLAKPSVIVTSVMILIYVWNEYIYATTFMTGADSYTLAVGLYSLQATETSGSWPVFAASSILVSLPVLIIFLMVQKHMVSGLTTGGMKG